MKIFMEAFNEDIFYMWRFQKSVILCIQIETPVGSMVFSFRGGRDEYPIPSKVRVTSLFILITSTDWWTEKSVGWQRTTCFKPSSKLSPGFIFWRVCHMPCPETSNGFPWLAEFGQNSEAWPWRPFPKLPNLSFQGHLPAAPLYALAAPGDLWPPSPTSPLMCQVR